MITALEFEDLVTFAESTRSAHRIEIRLRTSGDEAHLFGARNRLDNRLRQLDPPPVVGEKSRAPGDALLDGSGDIWMGVANQHRARAEQEINILPAALIPHPAASALADHHVRGKIAESPAGQHPLRLRDQPTLDLALGNRPHWRLLVSPAQVVSSRQA